MLNPHSGLRNAKRNADNGLWEADFMKASAGAEERKDD
jgi:hypothetical protein